MNARYGTATVVFSLLAATLLVTAAVEAQEFRYFGFGDSITFGTFDEANMGGYPGRLGPLLGCSPGVCVVDNKGVEGERTSAGVTRIQTVLNSKTYDVALIMEGTNDVFAGISNPTIKFNLEKMADLATLKGVDTVLASIIHFHPNNTCAGPCESQVSSLRTQLQGVAGTEGYYFADPWVPLCPDQACFNAHYFGSVPVPDPVGHPDASGYDIMAGVFKDTIDQTPTPGAPTPVSPAGSQASSPSVYTWNRESPQRATWYHVQVDGSGGNLFSQWYRAKDACSGTSCSITKQLNLGQGNYSWRARGRNPAGRSSFSASLNFSVQAGQGGPTLTLVSGSCAAGPSDAPNAVTIDGDSFPPNSEVAVVMASGNSGWVKGGTLCNGTSFEMSEPFVLPPTWVITDSNGSFTVQMTGEKCFVQSLALTGCEVSNLLILP